MPHNLIKPLKAVCPVCPESEPHALFGWRDPSQLFSAHCPDCRALYIWRPGVSKPRAILDSDKWRPRKYCDKDGCYCH